LTSTNATTEWLRLTITVNDESPRGAHGHDQEDCDSYECQPASPDEFEFLEDARKQVAKLITKLKTPKLTVTCEHRRHDTVVNDAPVRCLVARLEDWDLGAIYDLAVQMDQDCIAVLDVATGQGSLIGPSTDGYGTFDLAHFHRLKVDPAKGNSLLKKLFSSKLPIAPIQWMTNELGRRHGLAALQPRLPAPVRCAGA
jgi:hypothetical protein